MKTRVKQPDAGPENLGSKTVQALNHLLLQREKNPYFQESIGKFLAALAHRKKIEVQAAKKLHGSAPDAKQKSALDNEIVVALKRALCAYGFEPSAYDPQLDYHKYLDLEWVPYNFKEAATRVAEDETVMSIFGNALGLRGFDVRSVSIPKLAGEIASALESYYRDVHIGDSIDTY